MMTNDELWQALMTFLDDVEVAGTHFIDTKPTLAHYTSLEALHAILENDELWFSNPLNMNDLEEVRFGVLNGADAFRNHEGVRAALGTPERHEHFSSLLTQCIVDFDRDHMLDTYVFCFSEHDSANSDGILSMWRGYGGQGKGAALVIDTSLIVPVAGSPITIAKVDYKTTKQRLNWFEEKASEFATLIQGLEVNDDQIYLVANMAFQRLKQFAIVCKHKGFEEEKEWRAIYLSEHDEVNALKAMKKYHIGPRGIEPKLKLKIQHIPGVTDESISLVNIVSAILLGPSVASNMAERTAKRMIKLIKPELEERVHISKIPFRPT